MKKNIAKIIMVIIILVVTKDIFIVIANRYENKNIISSYFNNSSDYNINIMIIEIPQINLKRRVVKANDDFSNLNNEIVYYRNNDYHKTIILFGHSGMGYGTFFNRLDELDKNDVCYLLINKEKFVYYLSKISVIDEHDVGILDSNTDGCLLLITCLKNNNQKRLVLQFEQKVAKSVKK